MEVAPGAQRHCPALAAATEHAPTPPLAFEADGIARRGPKTLLRGRLSPPTRIGPNYSAQPVFPPACELVHQPSGCRHHREKLLHLVSPAAARGSDRCDSNTNSSTPLQVHRYLRRQSSLMLRAWENTGHARPSNAAIRRNAAQNFPTAIRWPDLPGHRHLGIFSRIPEKYHAQRRFFDSTENRVRRMPRPERPLNDRHSL